MIVNPVATGAVYLFLALPPTAFAARRTHRPWAAGLFGAACGILLSLVLNPWLPFHYWAHAQDFIIEPFVEKKLFSHPRDGLATLAFHVGVPVLFAMIVHRVWPREEWE